MTKKMNIPFSPPDISEEEINEVIDALKSGWITIHSPLHSFQYMTNGRIVKFPHLLLTIQSDIILANVLHFSKLK